jgi:serine/threonine protein kinase
MSRHNRGENANDHHMDVIQSHMTEAPGEVQFDISALMRSESDSDSQIDDERPDLVLTPAPIQSPTHKKRLTQSYPQPQSNTTPRNSYSYRNPNSFNSSSLVRTPQPSPALPSTGRTNNSYSQHFASAVQKSFPTVSLPPTPRQNNGHDSPAPEHEHLDHLSPFQHQRKLPEHHGLRRDSQDSQGSARGEESPDIQGRRNPFSRNSNPAFDRPPSSSSSHLPRRRQSQSQSTRGSVELVSPLPVPVRVLSGHGQSQQLVFEVGDDDVDMMEVNDEHLEDDNDDNDNDPELAAVSRDDAVSTQQASRRIGVQRGSRPPSREGSLSKHPLRHMPSSSRASSRTSSRTRSREHTRPLKHAFPGFDTMKITVVYEPYKTGFEASKEFKGRIGDLIAGRFKILDKIGSAQFSDALSCLDVTCNRKVALKIIKNDKEYVDQSLDEIKILELLNSRDRYNEYHVVQLEDYFYFREHLFLVFELLSHNLYEYSRLHRQTERRRNSITALKGGDHGGSGRRGSLGGNGGSVFFTLNQLADITVQLLEALEFVHGLDVIHCDLKPENILIERIEENKIPFDAGGYSSGNTTQGGYDSGNTTQGGYDSGSSGGGSSYRGRSEKFAADRELHVAEKGLRRKFHVKLIDFGGSCFIHDYLSSYVQSRSYRAPECIVGAPYSKPIDMWSLGCVLFEIYTGSVLFSNRPIPHVLNKMVSLLGPFPDELIRSGKHALKYFKAQRRRPSTHGSSEKKSTSGRPSVSSTRLMKPTDRPGSKVFSNGPPKSTGGWLSDDDDEEKSGQHTSDRGRRHGHKHNAEEYSDSSTTDSMRSHADDRDRFRRSRDSSRGDRLGPNAGGGGRGGGQSRWAIFERVPQSGSDNDAELAPGEGGGGHSSVRKHASRPSSQPDEIRFLRPTPTSLEERIGESLQRDITAQPHNTMLFVHFLKQLLDFDQNKRLTASAALQHPFIVQYQDKLARSKSSSRSSSSNNRERGRYSRA